MGGYITHGASLSSLCQLDLQDSSFLELTVRSPDRLPGVFSFLAWQQSLYCPALLCSLQLSTVSKLSLQQPLQQPCPKFTEAPHCPVAQLSLAQIGTHTHFHVAGGGACHDEEGLSCTSGLGPRREWTGGTRVQSGTGAC